MKAAVFAAALFFAVPALAADQTTNFNSEQAREDYRAYLKELKRLGQQYKEITGEMKGIIAEEGVPEWSDEADGIVMAKPDLSGVPQPAKADVKESGDDVKVRFDLPGLDRNALKVSVEDEKTLRVRGKRKDTGETVERVVSLPAAAENAQAKYEDGVLTVTAKKSKQTAKEVAVPVQ